MGQTLYSQELSAFLLWKNPRKPLLFIPVHILTDSMAGKVAVCQKISGCNTTSSHILQYASNHALLIYLL